MTITDTTLIEAMNTLNEAERQSVEQALKGQRTDEAAVILRWLRRRLKRVARAKKRRR
jgi:hypothetical protein